MGKGKEMEKSIRATIRCSLEEMDILPNPVSLTIRGMVKFLYTIIPPEKKKDKAQLVYFGVLLQRYATASSDEEKEYYLSQLGEFLNLDLGNPRKLNQSGNPVNNAINGNDNNSDLPKDLEF